MISAQRWILSRVTEGNPCVVQHTHGPVFCSFQSFLSHPSSPQADQYNNLLRRIDLTSSLVTTIAGDLSLNGGPPNNNGFADGRGSAASFYNPAGLAYNAIGDFVIVVRFLAGAIKIEYSRTHTHAPKNIG